MTALDLNLDPEISAVDTIRGHKFMPPADVLATVPRLYATDGDGPLAEQTIMVHWFIGGCDWWLAELDPETGLGFGPCQIGGQNPEWGYFDLAELAVTTVAAQVTLVDINGTHAGSVRLPIERDCYWSQRPWGAIQTERGER